MKQKTMLEVKKKWKTFINKLKRMTLNSTGVKGSSRFPFETLHPLGIKEYLKDIIIMNSRNSKK